MTGQRDKDCSAAVGSLVIKFSVASVIIVATLNLKKDVVETGSAQYVDNGK